MNQHFAHDQGTFHDVGDITGFMQYQIRDPKGFAEMLAHIAERDCMPELPFIRK